MRRAALWCSGPQQTEQHSRQAHRPLVVAEAAQRKGLGPEIENGLVAEGFAKGLGGNEIAPLHHVLRDRRVQAFVGIEQRDPQRQRVGEQHQGHCCQKGRQLPRLPGNHCVT